MANDYYRPVLSRRGFLAAGGVLSAGALLGAAGCSSSSPGNSKSGSSYNGSLNTLLPNVAPVGWSTVLAAVNKKLQSDLGFTIAPRFINWANYGSQALLQFTAGASFGTALEARWLNMTQLVDDGALVELDSLLHSGKYPNLTKTISTTTLKANEWSGKLWGLPQINSAGRIQGFAIRQDLAQKYGLGVISDYAALEKYFYDVKQKESGVIPMGLNSNSLSLTAWEGQAPLFNAAQWENPTTIPQSFTGDSVFFYTSANAASAGNSNPIPFWEGPGVVDALNRVRKYYLDGIINHDALNADSATELGYFTSGKTAGRWAITDGTSSQVLPALQKAVPGAQMANAYPFAAGQNAKPYQTFQADNFVVLNAKGPSTTAAMQLEDWLSVKANHDLISYGIEGKDWKPVGDDEYQAISQYPAQNAFPGYALCWRQSLERLVSYTTATEKSWYKWARDYGNFTTDPFSSFVPDVTPVENENAQLVTVMTQYAKPLAAGAVDVTSGLSQLKSACEGAGLAKVQAEMSRQLDAYLKSAT